MRYHEHNELSTAIPASIDYTGNDGAGLAPYASVLFHYDWMHVHTVGYIERARGHALSAALDPDDRLGRTDP